MNALNFNLIYNSLMRASEVREKYLKFFEKRGHKIIPPAPLVLKDDPTTLFTSSGMQPLVPYLMGKKHPEGKRLVDSQPSLRVQDIEDVGDNRHTTFFEMLGNWSLGDYFKREQLSWIWKFLTEELHLPKEKLYVSIFEGNDQVSEDKESYEIWKKLGVAEDHIFKYGVKKNWWSRAGIPDQMPVGEIGGPDSEVFFEFENVKHNKKYGETCHPNCDCGRFLEIGNSVFMQFKKTEKGLEELPNKNVDFGGGLERLTAATNDDPDVFKTDLFEPAIKSLEAIVKSDNTYLKNPRPFRIIVDHLRAAVFLASDGVEPSNKLQGYILRRLIRRAMIQARELGMLGDEWLSNILPSIVRPYSDMYEKLEERYEDINLIITGEIDRFRKTIDRGLKEFEKYEDDQLNALGAFNLYQSYGFPFEITQELFRQKGKELSREEFEEALRGHQQLSKETFKKISGR